MHKQNLHIKHATTCKKTTPCVLESQITKSDLRSHITWDYIPNTKYPKPSLHLNWFQTKTHLITLIQPRINLIMIQLNNKTNIFDIVHAKMRLEVH
jgi:hypothetical protein